MNAQTEKVAVIVFHGIGQQVPYQTIDSVATVLQRPHSNGARIRGRMNTTLAEVTGLDKAEPRAELTLVRANEVREVHVYEGYWAPFTAGKIGLGGVFWFLLSSAIWALLRCFFPFKRWMFGQWQEFRVKLSSFFVLALTAWVVVSLWTMMAVIALTAIGLALHFVLPSGPDGKPQSPPTPTFTEHVTASLGLFVVVVLAWGAALFATYIADSRRDPAQRQGANKGRPVWSWMVRGLTWLAIAVASWIGISLLGAVWKEIATVYKLGGIVWHIGWLSDWLWAYTLPGLRWYGWAIWVAAIGAFFAVRYFLTEFAGDAAIYITAHKVSEYWRVREEIATRMYKLVHAIYEQKNAIGEFEYGRVVIAGHSLGAMIAYDTLNRVLLEERCRMSFLQASKRTTGLLTFGAALDKSAFIFRNQFWLEHEIRERLAAARQPLIDDPSWRIPLPWINLYAKSDWFTSFMRYYDPAGNPSQPWYVHNEVDEYTAIFPFPVSHNTYWKSAQFSDWLAALIFK